MSTDSATGRCNTEIEITPEMVGAVLREMRGFDPIESDYAETANDIIKAVLANLPRWCLA